MNFFLGDYPIPSRKIGSSDSWVCIPELLNSNSFIVSGGVGNSISFEEELSTLTDCVVHCFDPSPTAVSTIAKINSHLIDFNALGLSDACSEIRFSKPANPLEGSFRNSVGKSDDVVFRCVSPSAILSQWNRHEFDLLKIDIEGFEYPVIDHLLSSKIIARQLLVEFHVKRQIGCKQNSFSILKYLIKLRSCGYRLINATQTDFSFIHETVQPTISNASQPIQ